MSQRTLAVREVTVPPVRALQVKLSSHSARAQIGVAMGAGFQRLGALLASYQLTMSGPPRAMYTKVTDERVAFTLAIPIAAAATEPTFEETDVEIAQLPAARGMCFTHYGPYDQLGATYREITAWLIEQGLIESEAGWSRFMPMWEEYVSDPDRTPASELITNIFLPTG